LLFYFLPFPQLFLFLVALLLITLFVQIFPLVYCQNSVLLLQNLLGVS
jgi:hypothetical protein